MVITARLLPERPAASCRRRRKPADDIHKHSRSHSWIDDEMANTSAALALIAAFPRLAEIGGAKDAAFLSIDSMTA